MILKIKHIILPFAICINIILAIYFIGVRFKLGNCVEYSNDVVEMNRLYQQEIRNLKETYAKKTNSNRRSNQKLLY